MSASLVGSEMCIRDSNWPDPHRHSVRAQIPGAAKCRRRRFRTAEHRARPVSYTHLTLPTICSV
eukprot:11579497-Alexandrium_andersonii.AAC.1